MRVADPDEGDEMTSRRRTAAVAATVVVIASLVAGAVAAVTRSSDEAALARARPAADAGIEKKVDRLLGRMTLEEKLQQLQLLSDGQERSLAHEVVIAVLRGQGLGHPADAGPERFDVVEPHLVHRVVAPRTIRPGEWVVLGVCAPLGRVGDRCRADLHSLDTNLAAAKMAT